MQSVQQSESTRSKGARPQAAVWTLNGAQRCLSTLQHCSNGYACIMSKMSLSVLCEAVSKKGKGVYSTVLCGLV